MEVSKGISGRQRSLRWVRWLVGVVLLAWLLLRVDRRALIDLVVQLSPGTIALLFVLAAAQQLLLAERLYSLLSWTVQDRGAGLRRLSRLRVFVDQQIAAAYGMLLPSSIGGDVARYVLIGRYLPVPDARARTLAMLLVDRLIGLAALCALPLALMVGWGGTAFAGAAASVVAVVAIVLWQSPRAMQLLKRVLPVRLERLRGFIEELELGLRSVPGSIRLRMFGWSLLYQVSAGVFFEAAASTWALGPQIHQVVWVGIPAALAATVLPVSIGGLGLRESLFAMVFTASGLKAEHGLVLGLLWGVQGLLSAAIGAVLQAAGGSDQA